MRYNQVIHGRFIDRPNRFTAHVRIDGMRETVHVKNTGRCRELLLPDAEVILAEAENPARKTKYDLIAVYKESLGWVNIDSQAPNKVALEWLKTQGYSRIRPEYVYGDSRLDFYMEKGEGKYLMEVKGCTLEVDGIGYFPDAPTERGVKHLRDLARAAEEGYHSLAVFVIQMEGVCEVRPNVETHAEFGTALEYAVEAGVEVLGLECRVTEDTLEVSRVNALTDILRESVFGGENRMTTRERVLEYALTFPDTYLDTPFRDDNWVLARYRKNKKAFAWTYERNGCICVNIKVDREWRDFWRQAYEAVTPGYHQNKTHWNTVILDGTVPDRDVRRMIAESYDLIVG